MPVWDRKPLGDEGPFAGAWRGEWGRRGREAQEDHVERVARRREREAERKLRRWRPQTPGRVRHFIAGVLVVEGVVAFCVGLAMVAVGWPPSLQGDSANRFGFLGMGVMILSVGYTAVVALGVRLYCLLVPPPGEEAVAHPYPGEERGTRRRGGPGGGGEGGLGWDREGGPVRPLGGPGAGPVGMPRAEEDGEAAADSGDGEGDVGGRVEETNEPAIVGGAARPGGA